MSNPEAVRGVVRSPENVIMDIVRRPVRFHDVKIEPYGEGFGFNRLQLGDVVLQLLLEVSEFLPRAASYRDFRVAAGAYALGSDKKVTRTLGYNVKVDDTDYINIHAEDQVLTKTTDAGSDAIVVMAVIGNPQEDHASGKLMPTLTPCGRCRDRLAASPLISPNTLFISARPDFTVVQLAPRNMPDEWDVHAVPQRVQEIDSSDYDTTIGAFLLQRYASM